MQGESAKRFISSIDCAKKIQKIEGLRGLYKGTIPRLGKKIINTVQTFTIYGYISQTTNNIWPD